jgi:diphthamide biosynthesis protein 3
MTVQELRAYGDVEMSDPDIVVDEGTFEDIARRYGILAKEVEEVKIEIARLEN